MTAEPMVTLPAYVAAVDELLMSDPPELIPVPDNERALVFVIVLPFRSSTAPLLKVTAPVEAPKAVALPILTVPAVIVVPPLYVLAPLSKTVPVVPEVLILSELLSQEQEAASVVEINVPLMVKVLPAATLIDVPPLLVNGIKRALIVESLLTVMS